MAKKWMTGCLAKVTSEEEYAQVMATVPKTFTPTCIADFGYKYTEEGRLVQLSNGAPFAWLGQKHYDLLGEAIIEDLYREMEGKFGFQRRHCPLDAAEGEPTIPIFLSPNFATASRVVMLIQGMGAVRPGMWARALCINDTLGTGTIFHYLEDCAREDWGVAVLNPNENEALPPLPVPPEETSFEEFWLSTPDQVWKDSQHKRAKSAKPIRGSDSPFHHTEYVWDQLFSVDSRPVAIIAHSFGGKCTTHLLRSRPETLSRISSIAFTDAMNDVRPKVDPKPLVKLMKAKAINWVASYEHLDKELGTRSGCRELSSGHPKHEWTSESCRASVIRFTRESFSHASSSSGGVAKRCDVA